GKVPDLNSVGLRTDCRGQEDRGRQIRRLPDAIADVDSRGDSARGEAGITRIQRPVTIADYTPKWIAPGLPARKLTIDAFGRLNSLGGPSCREFIRPGAQITAL